MDLKYIQKLIKMLDVSNLSELEIEEEGKKIKLCKAEQKFIPVSGFQAASNVISPVIQQPVAAQEPDKEVKTETPKLETPSENLYEVRSPMVGTYYAAPSPDSDPYVKAGSTIKTGDVLCIIEAMKLMNEIESEVSGKIVKILVQNAQAVEYNQPLFLIEKL
jgi:acetyl-CoA carboxylase biotin carboxyl carrier protein